MRRDVVATPILHDTPGELAQPRGDVRDWRAGECEPVPGQTMPNLVVVERDYGAVAEQWAALGPLVEKLGSDRQERVVDPRPRRSSGSRARNGRVRGGAADGRPSLERPEQVAEAILALSGVTNGRLAVAGFRSLEERCGVPLADLAEARRGDADHVPGHAGPAAPRDHLARVVGHRRGGPRLRGVHDQRRARQAVAHALRPDAPLPRPRVDARARRGAARLPPAARSPADARGRRAVARDGVPEITLRYLTPHSKWSIHSEYQDNLHMLTLFRGGSGFWMSPQDAEAIDVRDNDWVEAYNRNGIVVTRAVVSHRVPPGVCLMYHSKDRQINTPR